MPDAPISLTGLLSAKSPLLTLNKVHAFFLSISSIDALNNPMVVPVMVVANSLVELQRFSQKKCSLNEFLMITGLKINKIALDGGKRWKVAMLKFGKCGVIERIDEGEVGPVPYDLLDCCLKGPLHELLAYEGIVTRILQNDLVLFDSDILVVGVSDLVVGQKVKLFNLAKAPLHHSYIRLLSSAHAVNVGNVFIFMPYFSSLLINDQDVIVMNPPIYPSFCFMHRKARLRKHLMTVGFLKEASTVANLLWKNLSIGYKFLQMLSGDTENDEYFIDFPLQEIGKLPVLPVEYKDLSQSCRYLTKTTRNDGLIIGRFAICPVSGLPTVSDESGSILMHTEQVFPDGGLICISGIELSYETFLVDPLVMSTVCRPYIRPLSIHCVSSVKELRWEAAKTYYLVTISSVSPPSLTQIKPVKLQGSISGNCICVIKSDKKELSIKGTEKKVALEISPDFWYKYVSFLSVGGCVIAIKSPQGSFLLEFPVEFEVDAKLIKGSGKFLSDTRTLLVSREVYDHVLKKSSPSSIPQDIRSILSGSNDASFVHFRGVLLSVDLIDSDSNRVNPVFLRLFASHSIGLPIDRAKLRLRVADISEPTYEVTMDYSPSVYPVGLEKGAFIEGFNFKFVNGFLVSHLTSYIRIRPTSSLPNPTVYAVENDSVVPFHYLADFYGHNLKHPKTLVIIHCTVESIENFKFVAKCRKCGSSIAQVCCPIHGRLALSEINLEAMVNCLVHDGTFQANAMISELQLCLELLGCSSKLDQVLGFVAASGAIDQKLPFFIQYDSNLRFRRYRVKAIVTEAIQKVTKSVHFASRKVKVGRSTYQAYSYPGKVSLNVAQASPLDDKDAARRYLDMLEL